MSCFQKQHEAHVSIFSLPPEREEQRAWAQGQEESYSHLCSRSPRQAPGRWVDLSEPQFLYL